MAAPNFYRSTLESVAKPYDKQFAKVTPFQRKDYVDDWRRALNAYFIDVTRFDDIDRPAKR